MGILVDADDIVALFQHVATLVLAVKAGHVLGVKSQGQGLGSARLNGVGLAEGDEVGGSLLNAAIGVRRVEVDLHGVLTGHTAGVGDGDIQGDGAVSLGHGVDFLGKGGVGQAVAEGILNGLVIVDQALGGGSLVELVADVDALNIVDEVRGNLLWITAKQAGSGVTNGIRIGVGESADVVEVRCSGQVVDESVGRVAGGVDLTGNNLAQGVEAGLAGAGAPDNALDLGVLIDEAQLEGVGSVVNQHNVVEVGADEVDHVALSLAQGEVMLAVLEVLVLGGVVGVVDGAHIGGQVSKLTANAADDDHRSVRERLGVVDQLLGVAGGGGFGQGPVMVAVTQRRALGAVSGVEIAQLGVGVDAGVVQAIQQADGGTVGRDRAGAGAAVDRADRSPAKDVQVAAGSEGQFVVIVLQQDNAFLGNLGAQGVGLVTGFLGDSAVAGDQIEHGAHGAKGNQVEHDAESQQHGQARLGAHHKFGGLGQFLVDRHSDQYDNGGGNHNAKEDELRDAVIDHIGNVVQVNAHVCQGKKQGVHCFPPFIVPPSGWRLTGFPLLLMILYQNNFLSAHFLHKLLFPLHVLQKFQKHFIFCCASHTKHLDPVLCTPPKHQKWPGALS